ncbi:MAG TPA: maleylacetate reductase [Castellaniella sp.]|uniref:maleylacetate reductase n=1 Tax=Castellaniella sp. TaxID=1955812 RepID=UPI002F24B2A9
MSTDWTNKGMMNFFCPGGVYNATPPRVLFGAGMLARVRDEVMALGGKRAVVVTTPGRVALGEQIREMLKDLCVGVLAKAVSQVPVELAEEARATVLEQGADCIVSAGGGAAIGLGKGISLALGLPIVAVPTTYSGSEVTGFCGITINGVKRMHIDLNMLAHSIIYDPALTRSLPVHVSAASAMNALAHCIDVVYVPTANPFTKLAAVEGARVIAGAAPEVIDRPDDLQARSALLYGAYLGGVALTGGFALQHGAAHVLGGTFGIPHGDSHALVLPYVAEYNSRYESEWLGLIADALGGGDLGGAVYDLLHRLGITPGLQGTGLDGGQIEEAARITVETDNSMNPGPVTLPAVREILQAAWVGARPESSSTRI